MPPADFKKHLSQQEIQIIKRWIAEGAKWEKHWAYDIPSGAPKPPPIENKSWPKSALDHFVLAKIENAGLKPSADADRVTLLRRLYFDLIGLPPTPTQVKEFLNDKSPQSFEKLVDKLLQSPHFGERMAMYWLDLVRYADTVGYHGDQTHNVSPYRDWVINAFNNNMRFDQFTREQLAGDLLETPTTEQLIASGYNRLLQTSHEGGVQPKEYLAIYAADRVRNVSAVWMGATVGCAQCHDHKYDPYTSKDFYSMAAFFADIDDASHLKNGTNANPTRRDPEIEVVTELQKTMLAKSERQLELLQLRQLDLQNKSDRGKKIESIEKEIERLKSSIAILRKPRKVMISKALENPRVTRVLPRGNWLDETGPIVEPATPAFLGKITAKEKRATRLDFSNWLVNENAMMTSRAMVNRVWYLFFGEGISRDLADLGGQGVAPLNPELLDFLAMEFIESEWDLKALVKMIVTSRTYQQSSQVTAQLAEKDETNELFARQTSFRLPAEMIRDNALAISGLLVDDVGGDSAKPYQPAGYYRHLNFPQRKYQADKNTQQWRRGVYVHWQRQFLHPTFRSLDAPTREECTAQRPRSNTPLAALSLLNDPIFVEASRAFGQRIMQGGGKTDDQKIAFAFQWTLSRSPQANELAIIKKLLRENRTRYAADGAAAQQLISIGLSKPNPELEVAELAAWTNVCRTILNLNEAITRN
jgi:hypothetical protein